MSFKFGDVLVNGRTSPNNPYHKCIFLRKTKKFIYIRNFDGTLGEFYNDKDIKLTKVGSVIDESEMNDCIKEMRKRKREWTSKSEVAE